MEKFPSYCCPNCGAPIKFSKPIFGRYCEYCGTETELAIEDPLQEEYDKALKDLIIARNPVSISEQTQYILSQMKSFTATSMI